jgi:hypothetical protein
VNQARKPGRLRPHARSLMQALGEFLTPQVWKQVRNAASRRKLPRWDVRPLVLVLLTMTWCCGDSLAERFEAARGFYVVCHDKRRRPGTTFQGFLQALDRLPMSVLRALSAALRAMIMKACDAHWRLGGFIPLGCDGSRLECARTAELEKRLGSGGKEDSAPTVWVTAIVHLLTGVPWTWRFGRGSKPSERSHLVAMLKELPRQALVVADAGYYGYGLLTELIRAKVSYLIRMSSTVTLYTETQHRLSGFREGMVYYWPEWAQKRGLPAVLARLVCLRDKRRKVDVWLLTDVPPERLSLRDAGRYYRWRWENEGYFRTYKRTLAKMKLMSRTVREVHREAEASMIAAQLLLALGAQAMPVANKEGPRVLCSPRKVLLEIRRELHDPNPTRRRPSFRKCLHDCRREQRIRSSAKAIRDWPRRKPHKSPGPPTILTLSGEQKRKILQVGLAI